MKRHIDMTWALNFLIFLLAFPGLLWVAVSVDIYVANKRFVEAGKAACANRPAYHYFHRCNASMDGPACTLESRTRLMEWYDPVDAACAGIGDQEPFVFKIQEPELEEDPV